MPPPTFFLNKRLLNFTIIRGTRRACVNRLLCSALLRLHFQVESKIKNHKKEKSSK
jgi:hypothetical protein